MKQTSSKSLSNEPVKRVASIGSEYKPNTITYRDIEGERECAAFLDTFNSSSNKRVKRSSSRQILLSGFAADKRATFSKELENLGAEILVDWNDSCCHLIIQNGHSISEKYLGGLARGAWLLKPEYVAACINAGDMVDEQPFEWDGPGPRYWRQKGGRAFDGWKVYMDISTSKTQSFMRLLKAGQAIFVDDPSLSTICLVDKQTAVDCDSRGKRKVESSYVVHLLNSPCNTAIEDYLL